MPCHQHLLAATAAALLAMAPASAAAQTVRPYHPRIFLSAMGQRGISPATLRARCESSALHARACRIAAPVPTQPTSNTPPLTVVNNALRYLLFSEDSTLQFVRDEINRIGGAVDRGDESGQLLANAPRALQIALAYDWLYDALSTADRATLRGLLESYAEYALSHQPQDVFSSEAYAQAAAVGIAGLALAAPGDTAMSSATRYVAYANARWRSQLLPAMGYARGWWPEGPAWFNTYAGRYALYYAIAWTTATGEDLVAWARENASDPFNAAVRYQAYALRPDLKYPVFGDALGAAPAGAAGHRGLLDMLAWATGSPAAQSLAEEVSVRLPAGQDYGGREAWHQVVFYEPLRPSRPSRIDLPLAAHLSPTAADVVVMRGSWSDEDALHLTLSCGDWFTPRQHLEAGSFQLFRRTALAVHTGVWDGFETNHWLNWYAQRSIHANTLAIVRPGETFPNPRRLPSVNDGGQRGVTYTGSARATVSLYRGNLTEGAQHDTGSVVAFESSRFHDYAACNITRAYNSTAVTAAGAAPKVREVTRQVVLLRPELVVVFDRVEATDPTYDRRFTLHALARPVLDRDGRFSFTRGTGRLIGRTLLPVGFTTRVIDGYDVDGTAVNPLVPDPDNGGLRVEVSAPRGREREYFLHVIDATDPDHDAMPPASLIEDDDRAGVRIADPSGQRSYTVMFRRTGDPGGEVRVQDAQGATLYNGALGAGGTFYPVLPDAGVARPDDAAASDAGVGDAGGGLVPGGGGCSCRANDAARAPGGGGLLAGVALTALARRRRRSMRAAS
jgi:MYXO-CTERM domain-containing protein